MPNFESFSRRMLPLRTDPFVTIQRRGSFSLNRSAYVALGSPDSVELLYDRDDSIVGLRAIASNAENAYHVRHSARAGRGPWVISAMAFTKFYGIDTSVTRRWAARLDGDILCVELSGEPLTGTAPPAS